MPYVKQERRPDLDPIVEKMAEANLPGEYLWAHLLHTKHLAQTLPHSTVCSLFLPQTSQRLGRYKFFIPSTPLNGIMLILLLSWSLSIL